MKHENKYLESTLKFSYSSIAAAATFVASLAVLEARLADSAEEDVRILTGMD